MHKERMEQMEGLSSHFLADGKAGDTSSYFGSSELEIPHLGCLGDTKGKLDSGCLCCIMVIIKILKGSK